MNYGSSFYMREFDGGARQFHFKLLMIAQQLLTVLVPKLQPSSDFEGIYLK